MKAIRLKTEFLYHPIGVDFSHPRLMWNCEGGVKQTAYRITAFSEGKLVWESGETESDAMDARYPRALHSRERITWNVTLKDENGMWGEVSEDAHFEMGLLNKPDWQAKWISGNYTPKKNKRYPVDCFKKEFSAENIVLARLYITALGLYEARLNGRRVGDFMLAPGHTDYRRRVQYQTYDVTTLLQNGENELTLELADGWYRGSTGAWGLTCQYGKATKLLAQLEMMTSDGKRIVIATDKSFSWSNDGPIAFADMQDGEKLDARRIPSYDKEAKEVKCPIIPSCSDNVPVTEHEECKPTIIKTPSGKTVLDFGQNIAGYVKFTLSAQGGERIFLRFGELLDRDGEFTQANIQCKSKWKTTPLQEIEYICKEGKNEYKTKFAVFGFQYALVESDVPLAAEDFTAIAVYSDLEETLSFDCSNALVNAFVSCTGWSAKNNSLDVPTDCPTRERHGWTGDAQVFFDTASYLFDYHAFAKKFVRDMTDSQKKNGCIRQIVPDGGVDFYMKPMDGSVGWSDAGILIPYRMWKKYKDKKILEENFEAMEKYARFMMKRCGAFSILAKPVKLSKANKKYFVNKGQSYGEWAEPDDVRGFSVSDFIRPHPEESTAYTAYVMQCMTEIAELLGKSEKAKLYRKYAEGCKGAYRELVTLSDFTLDTDRQSKLVRPLYLDLLDEKQTAFAKGRLIEALENYGWRLGTGFLSTPFILYVLTEIDPEYAYKLLENERCPGWLFMPKNGATTVWEAWEGNSTESRGIASLNHYSKGAVCSWLFDTCCGIKMGTNPNSFVIAPLPGGTLTHAKASYLSVYGKIECGWEKQDGKICFTIRVPANTTAEIRLPSGEVHTALAGTHRFEMEML